jgi:hypothetical protein
MLTVGVAATGSVFTVTVTLSVTLLSSPPQVIAYVVVVLGINTSAPLVVVLFVQLA